MQEGWRYYNRALIPSTAPHEDVIPLEKGCWSGWGIKKIPLFARWTTEFDCGYETNWWYVIKDTPFNISELKAKRRYEINKGTKNFDVRIINPIDYVEEIYAVFSAAYSSWPENTDQDLI